MNSKVLTLKDITERQAQLEAELADLRRHEQSLSRQLAANPVNTKLQIELDKVLNRVAVVERTLPELEPLKVEAQIEPLQARLERLETEQTEFQAAAEKAAAERDKLKQAYQAKDEEVARLHQLADDRYKAVLSIKHQLSQLRA